MKNKAKYRQQTKKNHFYRIAFHWQVIAFCASCTVVVVVVVRVFVAKMMIIIFSILFNFGSVGHCQHFLLLLHHCCCFHCCCRCCCLNFIQSFIELDLLTQSIHSLHFTKLNCLSNVNVIKLRLTFKIDLSHFMLHHHPSSSSSTSPMLPLPSSATKQI